MWLGVCGDPDCPNKSRVEELEAEVARLKAQLQPVIIRWDEERKCYVNAIGAKVNQQGQEFGPGC